MKFVVDQTLGSLAKWLRLAGYDTEDRNIPRGDPGRLPPPAADTLILTRQRGLARRSGRRDVVEIAAEAVEEQLAEVLRQAHLGLPAAQLLSRCSQCNLPLTVISRETAVGRVPEHVFQQQRQFYECPRCRRLFWEGSHLRAIRRRLDRLREVLTLPGASDRNKGGEA